MPSAKILEAKKAEEKAMLATENAKKAADQVSQETEKLAGKKTARKKKETS